nr:MAG TPA: hypothetical protein [Caudoviricetes sp.]
MEKVNCLRCRFRHEDNGNCTAVGGFCTAVTAAHCPLLREYLDTGLEPESVEALKLSMMGKAISEIKEFDGLPIDRLRELAEADKAGRLVVLPVKPVLTPIISSMLYIIDDGYIYEDALYEADVGMSESGKTNVVYTTLSDMMIFEQADIGKTVFLTREEAEKALEAMKDG